jgi:hypothetical protein
LWCPKSSLSAGHSLQNSLHRVPARTPSILHFPSKEPWSNSCDHRRGDHFPRTRSTERMTYGCVTYELELAEAGLGLTKGSYRVSKDAPGCLLHSPVYEVNWDPSGTVAPLAYKTKPCATGGCPWSQVRYQSLECV